MNAVLLPLSLVTLVTAVWASNKEVDKVDKNDDTDGYDELRASKYSDFYFAVFLTCEFCTCSRTN